MDERGDRSRLVTLLSRRVEALDRATGPGAEPRAQVAPNGQPETRGTTPEPDMDDSRRSEPADAKPDGRTAAEWVTLAVSIVIVALMIGAALYEHAVRDEPAGVRVAVSLDLEAAGERDGLTYVPWTVENTGRDPAEQVVILFEIMLNGETVQESTADVPFLPNGGSADGELITDLDLATHTITARVDTLLVP